MIPERAALSHHRLLRRLALLATVALAAASCASDHSGGDTAADFAADLAVETGSETGDLGSDSEGDPPPNDAAEDLAGDSAGDSATDTATDPTPDTVTDATEDGRPADLSGDSPTDATGDAADVTGDAADVTGDLGDEEPVAVDPVIDAVIPTIVLPASQVTLVGSGFGDVAGSVAFDSTPAASIQAWSDTSITATLPGALAGVEVDVVVTSASRDSDPATLVITEVDLGITFADEGCVVGGIWSGAALGASSGDSAILGGLVFSPDGAQLLFINGAGTGDAALWGVGVTRASELGPVSDLTGGHAIVDTSLADGGIDLGPGDRLYYKTWNDNDLGEVADPLGTAGVPHTEALDGALTTGGGVHFDDAILGADVALLSTYGSLDDFGSIATVPLTLSSGNWVPGSPTIVLDPIEGPEGLHFVPVGSHAGQLLVMVYNTSQMVLYAWPPSTLTDTPTVFASSAPLAYGLEFDPVTDEIFVTVLDGVANAWVVARITGCP